VSNLLLPLVPILNRSTVLVASLFEEFVVASGDLRVRVDRLPGHGIGNAPLSEDGWRRTPPLLLT